MSASAGFRRAVARLRDRLADELPVRVSFALTFAAAEHLPAERGPGGWSTSSPTSCWQRWTAACSPTRPPAAPEAAKAAS
ncbi:hypothetical protein [Streptomyces rapamycinicus]|uniref:hypothetical protein n=1 Tax=Streptomyces rapamycinicus TaxID=1226757 RepID=UPI00040EEF59